MIAGAVASSGGARFPVVLRLLLVIIAQAATLISRLLARLGAGEPRRRAGAVASRGGPSDLSYLRYLRLPRPGEAHRTFYRVSRSRSTTKTSESRSRSTSSLLPRPAGIALWGALLKAPLTGEATSGGQTSEARMTVPRPFGKLCLIHTTFTLLLSMPDKQGVYYYSSVTSYA